MAAVTEQDLEDRRKKNDDLRQQIEAQQAKAAESAQGQTNAIEAAKLDAETARLEAQLAAAKEAAKAASSKEAAAGPLASVTEQLEAAKAPITPPGVAVDTSGAKSNDKE
jgi:hypothetical protein